jgi:hypothetical protein
VKAEIEDDVVTVFPESFGTFPDDAFHTKALLPRRLDCEKLSDLC